MTSRRKATALEFTPSSPTALPAPPRRNSPPSLAKLKGVSGAKCDRSAKTISFKADDAKAALAGLRALGRAGFYGTAAHGGKPIKYAGPVWKGTKADTVTLRGLHVCCGACVKAIDNADKGVAGVKTVKTVRRTRTVMQCGKGIDVGAAIAALNKAGFNARYGKRKKKK